ncbi:hypothetical protein NZD89_27065 [Alicyclobacillus fastidiosus]|uniref:Uncharacterized protein n=1 Tax=Alicyclobacillus fastidiosus TaxID=392011 RepID=A0ABY6ZG57_9BACL|nr:hypothetical protein [Alicyclobacillus fastidiosus]WAH41821.1 hypothetical protein NZD89_27065 [Alicyclobacillus fastidiosus]
MTEGSLFVEEKTAHPVPNAVVHHSTRRVPPVREWISRVSLWIPVYLNGNASLVVLEDGTQWYVPWKSMNLYQRAAKAVFLQTQDLRRAYEDALGRSQYVPFINPHTQTVYPALKVRNPHTRNDGAVGYFRLDAIQHLRPVSDETCHLHTHHPFTFDILMAKQSAQRRMRDAGTFSILVQHQQTCGSVRM